MAPLRPRSGCRDVEGFLPSSRVAVPARRWLAAVGDPNADPPHAPCPGAPSIPDDFEDATWAKLREAVVAVHSTAGVRYSEEELYQVRSLLHVWAWGRVAAAARGTGAWVVSGLLPRIRTRVWPRCGPALPADLLPRLPFKLPHPLGAVPVGGVTLRWPSRPLRVVRVREGHTRVSALSACPMEEGMPSLSAALAWRRRPRVFA